MTDADLFNDLDATAAALCGSARPALRRIGKALRAFLDLEAESIDAALGLSAPGRRAPATQATFAWRNNLLARAAAQFFPGRPVSEQARLVAAALTRYTHSAWPAEGHRDACPPRRVGTVEAVAWKILKAGIPLPAEDRLRHIIAAVGYELNQHNQRRGAECRSNRISRCEK